MLLRWKLLKICGVTSSRLLFFEESKKWIFGVSVEGVRVWGDFWVRWRECGVVWECAVAAATRVLTFEFYVRWPVRFEGKGCFK